MANKIAKIYECVKVQGRWTTVTIKIPNLRPDSTLYLRDDRDGKFRVSWYEGNKKQGSRRWLPFNVCWSKVVTLVRRH
jgi:hypothetical protein